VLEAMAMEKPILATDNAMRGIRSYPEFTPVIAETVEEMVAGAIELLAHLDENNLSAARNCVLEHYNWDTNLKRVDALLVDGL